MKGTSIDKKAFWTSRKTVIGIGLFCCFLWGSAGPFIKWGYAQFSIASSSINDILIFAGIRFIFAGLMGMIIGSFSAKKLLIPTHKALPAVLVLALFQTILQYYFYYVGLAHTSGVNGAILTGTGAFFALLCAALLFRSEKLTGLKILGCLVGFAGIFTMNIPSFSLGGVSFSFMGEGFILLSQICAAISACFIKGFTRRYSPVLLSAWQFFIGGLILASIGLAMGGTLRSASFAGWLDLLYLGFVSAAAYTLWGQLLKYNPVSKIGMFECFIPIAGVLFSAVLLQETALLLNIYTLIALILVITGIWLVDKNE